MVDNELGNPTDKRLEEFKQALYASGYPVVSDEELHKLYDEYAALVGPVTKLCKAIVEAFAGLAEAITNAVNAMADKWPSIEESIKSLQELAYEPLDPKVEFRRMLGRQSKRGIYRCQSQCKQPYVRKRVHRSVYSARPPPWIGIKR